MVCQKIDSQNSLPPVDLNNEYRLAADEPETRPAERTQDGIVLVNTPNLVVTGEEDTGKIKIIRR